MLTRKSIALRLGFPSENRILSTQKFYGWTMTLGSIHSFCAFKSIEAIHIDESSRRYAASSFAPIM